MPISLRLPPETNARLQALAAKTGKTKTALVLEALNKKYHFQKDRAQLIRDLSGWMSSDESEVLRESVADFRTVNEGDWP
jgi:predicted transcriptional regulator